MVLSFVLLVILPFSIITFFMVENFRDIMIEKAYNQSQQNMVRSKSNTSDALLRVLSVSDKVSLMYTLGDIVNKKYKNSLEVYLEYRDFDVFSNFTYDYPEISAIKIYVENQTMLNNWEFIPITKEITDRDWYKKALTTNGQNRWISFKDETTSLRTKLSLVRLLSFKEHGTQAVLVIDIDTERLNNLFSKESYDTFIVDEYGNIIVTNNPNKKESYYDLQGNFPKLSEAHGQYILTVENRKFHMLVDDISMENSSNGLKIFSIFSVSSIIEEANQVWAFGFRSMLVLLIFSSIALYLLYTLLVQRLIKVQESMDIVANGHFHSFIEIDGKDEIGKLSLHFNNMVKNINRLMTEIEVTNRQKMKLESHQNEIKLQMLASQINPHFLFNSLEAIRMKAHIDKQSEIANVVKQLGRLMRRVLEVEGSWFTLENELEIIKSFLEIEKFRLNENLTYHLDIDNECMDVLMPPLLIQPLVENALIHGIEKKLGGGVLQLKAKLINGNVLISIIDNGEGIPEEKRKTLFSPKQKKGSHIGIINVHERLKLSFGEHSGLKISEPDGGGVRIDFSVPKEENDE